MPDEGKYVVKSQKSSQMYNAFFTARNPCTTTQILDKGNFLNKDLNEENVLSSKSLSRISDAVLSASMEFY